jgi:ubiquinone/menaquinone biosynthesis C-methylase UbiE
MKKNRNLTIMSYILSLIWGRVPHDSYGDRSRSSKHRPEGPVPIASLLKKLISCLLIFLFSFNSICYGLDRSDIDHLRRARVRECGGKVEVDEALGTSHAAQPVGDEPENGQKLKRKLKNTKRALWSAISASLMLIYMPTYSMLKTVSLEGYTSFIRSGIWALWAVTVILAIIYAFNLKSEYESDQPEIVTNSISKQSESKASDETTSTSHAASGEQLPPDEAIARCIRSHRAKKGGDIDGAEQQVMQVGSVTPEHAGPIVTWLDKQYVLLGELFAPLQRVDPTEFYRNPSVLACERYAYKSKYDRKEDKIYRAVDFVFIIRDGKIVLEVYSVKNSEAALITDQELRSIILGRKKQKAKNPLLLINRLKKGEGAGLAQIIKRDLDEVRKHEENLRQRKRVLGDDTATTSHASHFEPRDLTEKLWLQKNEEIVGVGEKGMFEHGYPESVKGFVVKNVGALSEADRARIIDVGCSADPHIAGEVLSEFPDIKQLMALDIFDESYLKTTYNGRLLYRNGRAQETGLGDNSISVYISTFTMEYTDLDESIKELDRILDRGGTAILVFHHMSSTIVLYEELAAHNAKLIREELRDVYQWVEDNDYDSISELLRSDSSQIKSAGSEIMIRCLQEFVDDKYGEDYPKTKAKLLAMFMYVIKWSTGVKENFERMKKNIKILHSPQAISDFFKARGFEAAVEELPGKAGMIAHGVVLTRASATSHATSGKPSGDMEEIADRFKAIADKAFEDHKMYKKTGRTKISSTVDNTITKQAIASIREDMDLAHMHIRRNGFKHIPDLLLRTLDNVLCIEVSLPARDRNISYVDALEDAVKRFGRALYAQDPELSIRGLLLEIIKKHLSWIGHQIERYSEDMLEERTTIDRMSLDDETVNLAEEVNRLNRRVVRLIGNISNFKKTGDPEEQSGTFEIEKMPGFIEAWNGRLDGFYGELDDLYGKLKALYEEVNREPDQEQADRKPRPKQPSKMPDPEKLYDLLKDPSHGLPAISRYLNCISAMGTLGAQDDAQRPGNDDVTLTSHAENRSQPGAEDDTDKRVASGRNVPDDIPDSSTWLGLYIRSCQGEDLEAHGIHRVKNIEDPGEDLYFVGTQKDKNDRYNLYILYNTEGVKLGSVLIQYNSDNLSVKDIKVDEDEMGKGYAHTMMRWMADKAVAVYPSSKYPLEIVNVQNMGMIGLAYKIFDEKSIQIYGAHESKWNDLIDPNFDFFTAFGPYKILSGDKRKVYDGQLDLQRKGIDDFEMASSLLNKYVKITKKGLTIRATDVFRGAPLIVSNRLSFTLRGHLKETTAGTSHAGGSNVPICKYSIELDASDSHKAQGDRVRESVVGLARSEGFRNNECESLGFLSDDLVSNILEYGNGGKLFINTIKKDTGETGIELVGRDWGPGIENPEKLRLQSMRTIPSKGWGYYHFSRLPDEAIIESFGNRWEKDLWEQFELKGEGAVKEGEGTQVSLTVYIKDKDGRIKLSENSGDATGTSHVSDSSQPSAGDGEERVLTDIFNILREKNKVGFDLEPSDVAPTPRIAEYKSTETAEPNTIFHILKFYRNFFLDRAGVSLAEYRDLINSDDDAARKERRTVTEKLHSRASSGNRNLRWIKVQGEYVKAALIKKLKDLESDERGRYSLRIYFGGVGEGLEIKWCLNTISGIIKDQLPHLEDQLDINITGGDILPACLLGTEKQLAHIDTDSLPYSVNTDLEWIDLADVDQLTRLARLDIDCFFMVNALYLHDRVGDQRVFETEKYRKPVEAIIRGLKPGALLFLENIERIRDSFRALSIMDPKLLSHDDLRLITAEELTGAKDDTHWSGIFVKVETVSGGGLAGTSHAGGRNVPDTEDREIFEEFAQFVRERMKRIDELIKAAQFDKIMPEIEQIRRKMGLIVKDFPPNFWDTICDILLVEFMDFDMMLDLQLAKAEQDHIEKEAANRLKHMHENLAELDKLASADRLLDVEWAWIPHGRINASFVLGEKGDGSESTGSDERADNGTSHAKGYPVDQDLIDSLSASEIPITADHILELRNSIPGIDKAVWRNAFNQKPTLVDDMIIWETSEDQDIAPALLDDLVRWIGSHGVDRANRDHYPMIGPYIELFDKLNLDLNDPDEFSFLVHFIFTAMHLMDKQGHHRVGWALMNIVRKRERIRPIDFREEWYDEYQRCFNTVGNPLWFLRFMRGIKKRELEDNPEDIDSGETDDAGTSHTDGREQQQSEGYEDEYNLSHCAPEKFMDDTKDDIHLNYVASVWRLFLHLKKGYKGDDLSDNYREALVQLLKYHNIRTILDIGHMGASFLSQIKPLCQEAEIDLYGIERDPKIPEDIDTESIVLLEGDAKELQKHFKGRRFDIIMCSGVCGRVQLHLHPSVSDIAEPSTNIAISGVNALSDNPMAAMFINSYGSILLLDKESLERRGVKVLHWNTEEMHKRKETNYSWLLKYISESHMLDRYKKRRLNNLWDAGANVAVLARSGSENDGLAHTSHAQAVAGSTIHDLRSTIQTVPAAISSTSHVNVAQSEAVVNFDMHASPARVILQTHLREILKAEYVTVEYKIRRLDGVPHGWRKLVAINLIGDKSYLVEGTGIAIRVSSLNRRPETLQKIADVIAGVFDSYREYSDGFVDESRHKIDEMVDDLLNSDMNEEVTKEQATKMFEQSVTRLLGMKGSEVEELIKGKKFKMRIDMDWAKKYPEQYDIEEEEGIVVDLWNALRELFGDDKTVFDERITVTRAGERNGLITITCDDNGTERDSSIKVKDIPDIGPRTFDLILMAVLGSMVPNITDDKGTADYNQVLNLINYIYYRLTGDYGYIEMSGDDRDVINSKIRVIDIELDPLYRVDYERELEPEMADAVLSAV